MFEGSVISLVLFVPYEFKIVLSIIPPEFFPYINMLSPVRLFPVKAPPPYSMLSNGGIEVRLLLLKTSIPIFFRLDGKTMFVRLLLAKASVFISSTPFPKSSDVILLYQKAYSPIYFTVSGMVTLVNCLPLNTFLIY